MTSKHSVAVLQATSHYLGRKCPVSKKELAPGDQIVICHAKDEIVSWMGWPQLGGRCPYCGQVVSEWGSIGGPGERETAPKKKKPLTPILPRKRPEPITMPWRTIAIATIGLLVCAVSLLAFGVLRSTSEREATSTSIPQTVATSTSRLGTESSAGLATVANTVEVTSEPPTTIPSTPTRSPNPTATRASTPTRRPTHTSTPRPTSTPIPVLAYEPVSLGGGANASLDFQSPPRGDITLGGIPFQLSERVFKSQASPSPHNNHPTSILLSMNVSQAYRVHLLLNTGNGFNQFNGRVIGQVVAHCNGDSIPVTDLRLGREVREWHVADNVVSVASHARQVWSGTLADFPDLTGHIDMLSLDLPSACQNEKLTALEIIDSSATAVNSLDPALNLIGVTVEHYQ